MTSRAYIYIPFLLIVSGGIGFCNIALAQEGVAAGVISRSAVEYKSGGFRDPFQPPLVKQKKKATRVEQAKQVKKVDLLQPGSDIGNLKVQGIIWGGKIPQAIINDEVFSVGDTIEGIEILSIDKNGITLSSSGEANNLIVSGENPIPVVNTGVSVVTPVPAGASTFEQRP